MDSDDRSYSVIFSIIMLKGGAQASFKGTMSCSSFATGYSLAPAALVCALFVWGANHVGQIPRVFAGRYHQNYSIDLRVIILD